MASENSRFATLADLRAAVPQLGRWAAYTLAHKLLAVRVGNRLLIPRTQFERFVTTGEIPTKERQP